MMTVKEVEEGDRKVTMLQLVDLWKTRSPKSGIVEQLRVNLAFLQFYYILAFNFKVASVIIFFQDKFNQI